MLQITPHHTIILAVQPVDFRKGIDGLAALCRQQLQQQPFSGVLFVFTNRSRCAVKILVYDGQGFWLILKRFSRGKLAWWPTSAHTLKQVAAQQLQVLLYQGDPSQARLPPDWRPLPAACRDNSTQASPQGSGRLPADSAARPSGNAPDLRPP